MLDYVQKNIEFAYKYVNEELPGVKMRKPDATYLIWLDFKGTGLDTDGIEDLIINKARLWLDSGKIFGKTGEGFQRINAACPRSTLEEALNRIKKALQ